MKILELDLKKYVLIVEIPRLADYEFINKECKYLKVGNEEIKLNASTLDKFEFLCKGSDLTEEIASELVELTIMYLTYGDNKHKYRSYVNYNLGFDNALDSFISAIENKENFWLENPIGNKPMSYNLPLYKIGNRCDNLKQWQEAEEKTFKNPLIFVKK